MSDAEKQILKMKLVKTPEGEVSCGLCFFKATDLFIDLCDRCGDKEYFEPQTQIKIEIVEDKP